MTSWQDSDKYIFPFCVIRHDVNEFLFLLFFLPGFIKVYHAEKPSCYQVLIASQNNKGLIIIRYLPHNQKC